MAEIGLGTVQFGMNYGISNNGGKTSALDASKLLQVAIDNHIDVLILHLLTEQVSLY